MLDALITCLRSSLCIMSRKRGLSKDEGDAEEMASETRPKKVRKVGSRDTVAGGEFVILFLFLILVPGAMCVYVCIYTYIYVYAYIHTHAYNNGGRQVRHGPSRASSDVSFLP